MLVTNIKHVNKLELIVLLIVALWDFVNVKSIINKLYYYYLLSNNILNFALFSESSDTRRRMAQLNTPTKK